jgi:hypothetical protein
MLFLPEAPIWSLWELRARGRRKMRELCEDNSTRERSPAIFSSPRLSRSAASFREFLDRRFK